MSDRNGIRRRSRRTCGCRCRGQPDFIAFSRGDRQEGHARSLPVPTQDCNVFRILLIGIPILLYVTSKNSKQAFSIRGRAS